MIADWRASFRRGPRNAVLLVQLAAFRGHAEAGRRGPAGPPPAQRPAPGRRRRSEGRHGERRRHRLTL
ncbi:hypothetical protein ACRAWD_31415 [Caulobacter segnis]